MWWLGILQSCFRSFQCSCFLTGYCICKQQFHIGKRQSLSRDNVFFSGKTNFLYGKEDFFFGKGLFLFGNEDFFFEHCNCCLENTSSYSERGCSVRKTQFLLRNKLSRFGKRVFFVGNRGFFSGNRDFVF